MKKDKFMFYKSNWFCIIFFVTLFSFQLIHLDSDPSPIKRWADLADEGYWLHNARLKVLFGNFQLDDLNVSYLGAPLFNALTHLSFKLFGVSIFSGRLVTIISLWLIILMLFFMLKPQFGQRKAMVSAGLFGFMHEVLMYAKWGTPVLLEVCLFTAILFFYWLGSKNSNYYYLSGFSFAFAILAKLTAILFIPALLIFVLLEVIRERMSLLNFTKIFSAIILILVPFTIAFVIPNYSEYVVMIKYVASTGDVNLITFIKQIILLPLLFKTFQFPTALFVFVAAIFYFVTMFFSLFYTNWKKVLNELSVVEIYCISWIIGGSIGLCINGQMGYDRRMVHFYVPFFILALFYMFNLKEVLLPVFIQKSKAIKLFLITVITLLISGYFIVTYQNALAHWLPISSITNIFHLRVRHLLILAIPLGLSLSYLYFKGNSRLLKRVLVFSFLFSNILLNSIWYGMVTFTLRDESARIKSFSSKGMYITGWGGDHWLAINNETLPIWYWRTYKENNGINIWFRDYMKSGEFLLLSQNKADLSKTYVDTDQFDIRQLKLLRKINLYPLPFTGKFRDQLELYVVNQK